MKLTRRRFVQIGSVTMAGLPLLGCVNNTWYNTPSGQVENSDELFALFKDPTGLAKPFVRWWWNGNRITKEEIARELDLLKEAGIGGVEINSIAFPPEADPLDYKELIWLSEEWTDILNFTVQAAREREIICDLIVGSGWPFGGEHLTKDEQTQMMGLGTKNLKGPLRFEISRQELENEVDPPIVSKNPEKYKELSFLRLSPAQLDKFDPGIDFNSKTKDDQIVIDIPEGDYVLYFLVKLTGFEKVIHGAPGASGPVLNHYDQVAVEKYLNRMSDAITSKLGTIGDQFRSLFADSLELEGANWCDDMTEQFKLRKGYDLEPFLPFILFKIVGHAFLAKEDYGTKFSHEAQEIINNVRYDFETNRMELFSERLFQTYAKWCEKIGVKTRVQAYGMEYHPIEGSMKIDYPEGESWIKPDVGEVFPDHEHMLGRAYRPVNKLVSSGARLAGKKVIGCEEATNTGMVFNATMERLKITGDQSNLSGMTHSIFHGFNYSPQDAPFPGWVRYGTFINERNPIWPYFKLWFSYKARLSALFQNAELISDIAIMFPLTDVWKGYGVDWYPRPQKARPDYLHNVWEAIHQNGNSCDCISEHILQKATFKNGNLKCGERSYKTLILIEVESMLPDTAVAISNFAKSGGQIICIEKWPAKSAGLKNYEENCKIVQENFERSKKDYPKNISLYPAPKNGERIIDWYQSIQDVYQITPYVKINKPDPIICQVYYKAAGLDIFFIANNNMFKSHKFTAEFDVKNKIAWLWDAETGERTIYPVYGADHILNISLGPAESKLIVFDKNGNGEKYIPVNLDEKPERSVSGPWSVTLNHMDGSQKKVSINELVDFKEDDRFISFAGTALYETTIQVDSPQKLNYLHLGEVFGVSEVTVNGENVGLRWYGDHIYSLKDRLKKGPNTITIKLTTTMGNYMKSLKDNKSSVRWVEKGPFYSQGMIGPVGLFV